MDWEKVRMDAAIAAMQSFVTVASFTDHNREVTIAKLAVMQADALVEELKKK